MTVDMVWSGLLTMGFGMLSWFIKGFVDELKRITILLNRTREEMAKEYVTKAEVNVSINQVIARLEALDAKLDRIIESYKRS